MRIKPFTDKSNLLLRSSPHELPVFPPPRATRDLPGIRCNSTEVLWEVPTRRPLRTEGRKTCLVLQTRASPVGPLVHRWDGPWDLQKHFKNWFIPLKAEVCYKMCQGRVAVLYGHATWGTRPR